MSHEVPFLIVKILILLIISARGARRPWLGAVRPPPIRSEGPPVRLRYRPAAVPPQGTIDRNQAARPRLRSALRRARRSRDRSVSSSMSRRTSCWLHSRGSGRSIGSSGRIVGLLIESRGHPPPKPSGERPPRASHYTHGERWHNQQFLIIFFNFPVFGHRRRYNGAGRRTSRRPALRSGHAARITARDAEVVGQVGATRPRDHPRRHHRVLALAEVGRGRPPASDPRRTRHTRLTPRGGPSASPGSGRRGGRLLPCGGDLRPRHRVAPVPWTSGRRD